MSWLFGKNSTSSSQIPPPTPLQQQRLKQIKSLSNYNQKYGFRVIGNFLFFILYYTQHNQHSREAVSCKTHFYSKNVV